MILFQLRQSHPWSHQWSLWVRCPDGPPPWLPDGSWPARAWQLVTVGCFIDCLREQLRLAGVRCEAVPLPYFWNEGPAETLHGPEIARLFGKIDGERNPISGRFVWNGPGFVA